MLYYAGICLHTAGITGLGVFGKLLGLSNISAKDLFLVPYLMNARKNTDQPIELPSEQYTDANYGGIVYGKTSLVFD